MGWTRALLLFSKHESGRSMPFNSTATNVEPLPTASADFATLVQVPYWEWSYGCMAWTDCVITSTPLLYKPVDFSTVIPGVLASLVPYGTPGGGPVPLSDVRLSTLQLDPAVLSSSTVLILRGDNLLAPAQYGAAANVTVGANMTLWGDVGSLRLRTLAMQGVSGGLAGMVRESGWLALDGGCGCICDAWPRMTSAGWPGGMGRVVERCGEGTRRQREASRQRLPVTWQLSAPHRPPPHSLSSAFCNAFCAPQAASPSRRTPYCASTA